MKKPMELLCMLPESGFQPEHNINTYSIVLEDAHLLQEAKDGLSSLHEGEYNSITPNHLHIWEDQNSFK